MWYRMSGHWSCHGQRKQQNNGMLFLQETHSSDDTVINWRDDFKGELFFSHRTTNSCGVMIGYLDSNKIKVNRTKNEDQGRILIVEADIDEETFVVINLYNSNTEMEQIKTIYELDQLLNDVNTCRGFQFIL